MAGKPKPLLSESQIRYAMANSENNYQASLFLGVSRELHKRSAELYIDKDTGVSLYTLHDAVKSPIRVPSEKSRQRKQRERGRNPNRHYNCNSGYRELLEDVLSGKYPGYCTNVLRTRVLTCGWIKPECENCGWDEYRLRDGNFPLLINFRDTNWRNCRLENIQLLCYNCYFCQVRNLHPNTTYQKYSYKVSATARKQLGLTLTERKKYDQPYDVRRAELLKELNEKYKIMDELDISNMDRDIIL